MTRAVRSLARAIGATLTVSVVAWSTVAAQVDPSIFEGMAARSIGPAGMSGRIGAIDAVELNPNIIYVGAATGGLWKSVDGGVTFEPIMDDQPASSIGAVAIFQAAPDIVWIGTGEKGRRNSAGSGTGLYKTMDGGKSWEFVGLRNTGAISEIILHPSDPNVAYVGALGNTWGESTDRGVYKTSDGGKTWSKILYVDERTGAADLVMDPANPNKLFAAMWQHRRWPWFFNSGGPGSGLYVTWDGGANWKRYTTDDGMPEGDLGRIGLDISRSDPNVVYALVEAKQSVLLRSDDAGHSWETVNETDDIANRPFYYGQVRVDPENENRVYNVAGSVTLSEDGGKSFQPFSGYPQSVHVDHHAWWINPHDGRLIINGNDGGVYISYDRGGSWTFVHTLPLAQFYHINVDMDTPFNVYGGLQDNGSWMGPSSVWENGGIRFYHWAEVGFGDGFATVSDPNTPRYGYGMSQGGNIYRFDKETGGRKNIRPVHPDGVFLRFNWNAGIAIDPFDGCVYYGSQFVHKTCDMGHSWTIISPDLTTNDPEKQNQLESGGLTYDVTNAENHTTIITIAPSPVEQGVIWVGTDDGNVQVTRDGGATWTNVVGRAPGVPQNTYVTHVEPSKFDGGTAFVTFDDHRRGNNAPYAFRVTNYGRSWTSLVTDEIEGFNFVHVIEQDPVNASLLFLGTEYGMYVTLNGGSHWFRYDHGLGRFPHRALIVHPRDHDLVVGSHGRAAYVLDDIRPFRALMSNPAIPQQALHLFEIPPAIQYHVGQVGGIRFTGQALFIGENRPYGALLTYFVREGSDSAKVTIEVLDADDNVIRNFEGPAKTGVNRTSWNLRHDAYRRVRDGGPPSRFQPSGPAVLPGTYTVRVKRGDAESTATVAVSADPRFDIPLADMQEKHRLMLAFGAQAEVGTEAVERIRSTTKAVDQVLGQVRSKKDSTSQALADAGTELKKALEALEERFRGRQNVQGIRRDPNTVQRRFLSAYSSMSSTWEKPTEAELLALEQGRAILAEFLEEFNRVFAEDVAAFRDMARAADLDLFPEKEPLSLDWTGPGR
jgi:photosystem II stability/assembly factor-like uncharacterized protein